MNYHILYMNMNKNMDGSKQNYLATGFAEFAPHKSADQEMANCG